MDRKDGRLPVEERREETQCDLPECKALSGMGEPWQPMMIPPPAAASPHLEDGQLFTGLTSARAKHLADCAWCKGRHDAAASTAPAESDDNEDFERILQSGPWHEEFSAASREAVLPDKVRVLMGAPSSVGDVEPGQIWRLTWRRYHLLVAVVEVADWQVLAAPVTTDVGLADEFTLLVAAAQSPLDTGLAVWVRNRTAIPLFVFERPIGLLPPIDTANVTGRAALEHLVRAHMTGSPIPSNLPVGLPLMENDVDRLAMHDALWEQTDWFAAAAAGLVDSDGHVISDGKLSRTLPGPKQSLSDLLRRSGQTLPELAANTGIKRGRLVDLARPGATPSADETAAIELATGKQVAADSGDLRLKTITALAEVSRPSWRTARQRWTEANYHGAEPEDPAPLVKYLIEHPVAARSIRHDHDADDPRRRLHQDWQERLAMILSDYQ